MKEKVSTDGHGIFRVFASHPHFFSGKKNPMGAAFGIGKTLRREVPKGAKPFVKAGRRTTFFFVMRGAPC
jgi:hypothetical protein